LGAPGSFGELNGVKTLMTPGAFSAADVSIDRTRPLAMVLVTITA
jgi:hypothetical protein